MRINVSRTASWLVLTALIAASGLVLLHACDFGPLSLFDRRYCVASRLDGAVASERVRAQDLQARVREAELRIAEKPTCAPPPGPKGDMETQVNPQLRPKVEPDQKPVDPLTIPKKISELKGCWESVSGDLPIVTDDKEERLIGYVRKCYCFGANGHGQLKLSYTDGAKCRSPLSADLSGDMLRVRQPEFACRWKGQNRGLVPSEITCRGAQSEAAVCDAQNHGRNRTLRTGDQYRRVEKDHCG